MLMDLLDELDRLGIMLQADGDRLRFHPREVVTPDMMARLRVHKTELLTMLQTPGAATDKFVDWIERPGPDGYVTFESPAAADMEILDVPAPCPQCGGIVPWWDLLGELHCEHCEPRTKSEAIRRRALELRERYSGRNLRRPGQRNDAKTPLTNA
jgi:hypothetical protein